MIRGRVARDALALAIVAIVGWYTVDLDPRAAFVAGAALTLAALTVARHYVREDVEAEARLWRGVLIDLYGATRFLRADRWRDRIGHDDDVYVALTAAEYQLGLCVEPGCATGGIAEAEPTA